MAQTFALGVFCVTQNGTTGAQRRLQVFNTETGQTGGAELGFKAASPCLISKCQSGTSVSLPDNCA
jgi:hypothetical protein